jgi:hypothetical protein
MCSARSNRDPYSDQHGAGDLYRRVLGERWHALPESVREMHTLSESFVAQGRAEVRRGTSWLARVAAAVFGFPRTAADVPVEVSFDLRGDRQIWTRRFGPRTFSSSQWHGTGRFEGMLCERFGAFTFGIELTVDSGHLHFVVRRAELGGLRLPAMLSPVSITREFTVEGRFRFDVEIRHPVAGLIIAYRGWLVPIGEVSRIWSSGTAIL